MEVYTHYSIALHAVVKAQEVKIPITDENLQAVQRDVMVESKGLKGRKMAMIETAMKEKAGVEEKKHEVEEKANEEVVLASFNVDYDPPRTHPPTPNPPIIN
ncbi:hypothetical protein AMTR_s00059p00188700 [Amborella trichopoda]|uniref:Uncharacterized protein n=1 Tax=Amborella trichopoda TaxID=13333 RepID=U5D8B7_AMBTC|nr:hypothetical protein AMTR_s00059p00188700 [Amborella trichopoda]